MAIEWDIREERVRVFKKFLTFENVCATLRLRGNGGMLKIGYKTL